MKNEVYINVKNSKLFKSLDLLIYVSIVILILALFFAFVIFPKDDVTSGFKVVLDNKTVLTYDFSQSKNGLSIKSEFSSLCEASENGDDIIIKIYIDDSKQEYNTINVDKKNKTVKMLDANCSSSRDCVHFAPVGEKGGSIICVPHKLSIVAISSNETNLVVG